jgi:hypothetical protein
MLKLWKCQAQESAAFLLQVLEGSPADLLLQLPADLRPLPSSPSAEGSGLVVYIASGCVAKRKISRDHGHTVTGTGYLF